MFQAIASGTPPPPLTKSLKGLYYAPAERRVEIKPIPSGPGHKHGFLSIIILSGLHYDIKYIHKYISGIAEFRDL